MRRVLVVIALVAGCRRAGETTKRPLVPLDEPMAPAEKAAAQPKVDMPTPDQLTDIGGRPPPSAPVGDPIVLAWTPPHQGAVRVRTMTTVTVDESRSTNEGKQVDRRQVSRYGYRFTELASLVENGRIVEMHVTTHDARESVELDGKTREQLLLWGAYDVDVANGIGEHGRIYATRDHREVEGREQEELGVVFGLDDGNESGMHQVARAHPLRVGESISLTDAEKQVYAGGPSVPDPIALTLVEVTDELVTLRIDATVDRGGGSAIRHREVDRYRLSTGALVDKILETESIIPATNERSRSRTHVSFDTTAW